MQSYKGNMIAFTIPENPIADYQQVTDIEIPPYVQNNFPSKDFIAGKLRYEKSMCQETDVIVTMCEKSHFFWERMRIKRHYKCFLYTQVCVTHTCVSVFPLSYNNIRCEPISWIHTLLYI